MSVWIIDALRDRSFVVSLGRCQGLGIQIVWVRGKCGLLPRVALCKGVCSL